MHERTHTDLCKLRFNKTLETHLYALNQHIKPPGLLIYSSSKYSLYLVYDFCFLLSMCIVTHKNVNYFLQNLIGM